ncbi:hypothetical protein SRB5_49850 [Streptomyces sp. RB5]|uniref:Histidine kinase/HSP90-like ATPase domain-containing protein n=1 Tax=Streptomyces smaragdinus TaxID=2585196 RepID=A0A7K0CMZ7_9ACTN|nr:ATP-binding protein [Streptomyces smaragdinus]MQY14809.1 hypothetical protein [Streptomyces smaragdinus]
MATALQLPAPPEPPPVSNYRLSAENSETAAAVLRDLIGALLRTTGHEALVDDARLCTSELVTNVHRHTATRVIHVDVEVHERHVTVWVHDDRPSPLPIPQGFAGTAGGLGLFIVDRIADAWGTSRAGGLTPRAKAVWFRLVEDPLQPAGGRQLTPVQLDP